MSFGGSSTPTTTETQPAIRTDIPLQSDLVGLSQNQLARFGQYSSYGAGYQFAPSAPLGQVYAPGANPTIQGNPYGTGHEAQYGPTAQAPTNLGYTSHSAQGNGGGNMAANYNGGGKLGAYVPQGLAQMPAGRAYAAANGGGPPAASPPPPAGLPTPTSMTGNYAYTPGTGPAPPAPTPPPAAPAPAQGQNQQQAPMQAPAPFTTTGGVATDPYGFAAGNAPVGPNGQPMTQAQLVALSTQLGYAPAPPAVYNPQSGGQPPVGVK